MNCNLWRIWDLKTNMYWSARNATLFQDAPDWSENMWLRFGCGSQFSSWATTLAQVSSDQDCCLVWWLLKLECYLSNTICMNMVWLNLSVYLYLHPCMCIWIDWRRWGARGCGRAVKSSRVSSTAATPSESNEHTTSFWAKIVFTFVFVFAFVFAFILHFPYNRSVSVQLHLALWEAAANYETRFWIILGVLCPIHCLHCSRDSILSAVTFGKLWHLWHLLASFGIFDNFWQVLGSLASFGNCRPDVVWQFEQFQATMSSWAPRLGGYGGLGTRQSQNSWMQCMLHVLRYMLHCYMFHKI